MLFHLINTEHLKLEDLSQHLCSSPVSTEILSFICLHRMSNEGHRLTCPLENTGAKPGLYSCFCFCLCPSFYVLFFCPPVCLSMCLDTIHRLIQSDPALVWREVARAEYTNCFLAVKDKLLASPFKLHFRV